MGVPPADGSCPRSWCPAALPSILLGRAARHGRRLDGDHRRRARGRREVRRRHSGGIGQMMFVFYAYSIDLNGIVVCMIVVGVVALLIDRFPRAAALA